MTAPSSTPSGYDYDITPRAPVPRPLEGQSADLGLGWLFAGLMRQRWLVVGSALLVGALVGVSLLLRPRQWSSSASFTPQGGRAGGAGLAGLAAQFGVEVGGAEGGPPAPFYVTLLESREVLRGVATAPLVPGRPGVRVLDALDLDDGPAARRQVDAIRELRDAVSVRADTKTGVVQIGVITESPELSYRIVQELLAGVTRYNMERRQGRAGSERRFTERRLAEAAQELRQAEDRLQEFLQGNRAYQGAPALQFRQERLAREVALRQTIYGTLQQSYEQARIEEVRDTPQISLMDPPELPARPEPRGLLFKVPLATIAGGLLGLLVAGVRLWRSVAARPAEPPVGGRS